ncbi:uncharacterized protein [Littorina saxatilis]|uniref:Uncharacterized protein n=1 Tax=Littorina saxatilis TaxID=31220 RepID=A0AAN9BLY7_9CAEN
MATETLHSPQSSRQCPPTPIPRPVSWKGHVYEDLLDIPTEVFSGSKNHEKWEESSVREAAYLVRQLGTKLPVIFFLLCESEGLMTLKGRVKTYPADWIGWDPLDMAFFGLFLNGNEKVECVACGVTFRKLRSRDICHVRRHKQLSPNCMLLKLSCRHQSSETTDGRRARRHSLSALDVLRSGHIA